MSMKTKSSACLIILKILAWGLNVSIAETPQAGFPVGIAEAMEDGTASNSWRKIRFGMDPMIIADAMSAVEGAVIIIALSARR
jgi:hypothetical protein